MARHYEIFIWKRAPFIRLLIPFILGIAMQHYFYFPKEIILLAGCAFVFVYLIFRGLTLKFQFRFSYLQGIVVFMILMSASAMITWNKDVRNHQWFGNFYDSSATLVAVIKEAPVEKAKSYKAVAGAKFIVTSNGTRKVTGDVLLYFAKDSSGVNPFLDDTILIKSNLQAIRNSGNPGAFNYARYAAFHGLHYQGFLRKKDYVILGHSQTTSVQSVLYHLRKQVRDVLYRYIPGTAEKTIAAALLIGYKIDLDKDLVQAYSNAGIVHLIAISGLHIGIIYTILLFLFAKVPGLKNRRVLRMFLVIILLWVYAIITGGTGSVLRAACMFTFIAIGSLGNKKVFIYNSMAASAFLLLCYNPFLLWDVGFQLSYLAVAGIVVAQRSIANWFVTRNHFLRRIWQLASVSIAAQLFTFPVCIYYFHQLPLLFLFSNLIAIPLMVLALWSCLFLLVISPVTALAMLTGKFAFSILWMINKTVAIVNSMPFSLWDEINLTLLQTFLLYAVVFSFLRSLLNREKLFLKISLVLTVLFLCVLNNEKFSTARQHKFVVYNVPSHRAMDFISANHYYFSGDEDLRNDGVLRNFHLKPGRIAMRSALHDTALKSLIHDNNLYQFRKKTILNIQNENWNMTQQGKIKIDYLVISGNPRLYMQDLLKTFDPAIIIFDGSNPLWKVEKWKKDCERLHLRFYSVPEQGAFIQDI
jgi:competence protein ComEC